MRILKQHLLVKPYVPEKKERTTDSGIILDYRIESHWGTENADIVSGIVVAVPENGWQYQEEDPATKELITHDMECKIKVGDIVHFHDRCYSDSFQTGKAIKHNGEDHIFIDYDLVHFYIRDGKIYGTGQYFICDPVPESMNDVLTNSGILTKPAIGNMISRGIIRFLGDVPSGYEMVEEGMMVCYNMKQFIYINVPGYDYKLIRMRWRNLLFAYNEGISDEELAKRIADNEQLKKEMKSIQKNIVKTLNNN